VLLPYQFTGSGFVVAGIALVVLAKASLVRSGLGLARPLSDEAARAATRRALAIWMSLFVAGVVCLVIGLFDLLRAMSVLSLVNFALSIAANILVLTLIGTDAVITGLDRARGSTPEERKYAEEAQAEIAAFTTAGTQDR